MLERMAEQGQTVPALEDRPTLLPRLRWYFDCFVELDSDRSYASGHPLRLSTGQMHAYWKAYELYNFEDFSGKIRQIDDIWSTKRDEKRKREEATKQAPKGSAPPALK